MCKRKMKKLMGKKAKKKKPSKLAMETAANIETTLNEMTESLSPEDYGAVIDLLGTKSAEGEGSAAPKYKIEIITKGRNNGSRQQYWRLKASNGKILAVSEIYTSSAEGVVKKLAKAINEKGECVIKELDQD